MLDRFIKRLSGIGELALIIKVTPNANSTGVKEIMADEVVKLSVAAPPQKDKANQELIKYLARVFKVNKENVTIIKGKKNKQKLIKIIK